VQLQDRVKIACANNSRFQTAHLVPAARCPRPGFASLLRSPAKRVGGAPRDVRVLGGTPVGPAHDAAGQALARRLASHDGGRAPLGAPPWGFWPGGPRSRLFRRPPSYNGGQLPSDPCSELLAARS